MKKTMIRSAALALLLAAPTPAQETKTAKEFAEALAAWQLEAATNGAETEALAALREELQKAVLAAPEDEALFEALVEVEAAWITRQIAVVKTAKADSEVRGTVARRFDLEAVARSAEAALAAANSGGAGPLEKARARAAEAPAVREWLEERARERKAAAPKTPVQSDVALRAAIETALAEGSSLFVESLGPRAVPALVELARTDDGSPTPESSLSALRALLRVDAGAGHDVALELVGRDDLLERRAVASVDDLLFSDASLWRVESDGSESLAKPEWAEIPLALHPGDGAPPLFVKNMLETMAGHGYLPAPHLEIALRTEKFSPRTTGIPEANLREVCGALLKSEDPITRSKAAEYFVEHERDVAPVLALAGSHVYSDARAVRDALGPRTVVFRGPAAGELVREAALPTVDAAYAEALVRQLEATMATPSLNVHPVSEARKVLERDPARALSPAQLARIARIGDAWQTTLQYALELPSDAETAAVEGILPSLEDADATLAQDAVTVLEAAGKQLGAENDNVAPETLWLMIEWADALGSRADADIARVGAAVRCATARPQRVPDAFERMDALATARPELHVYDRFTMAYHLFHWSTEQPRDAATRMIARASQWNGADTNEFSRAYGWGELMERIDPVALVFDEEAALEFRARAMIYVDPDALSGIPEAQRMEAALTMLTASVESTPRLDNYAAHLDLPLRKLVEAALADDRLTMDRAFELQAHGLEVGVELAREILAYFPPHEALERRQVPGLFASALEALIASGAPDVPGRLSAYLETEKPQNARDMARAILQALHGAKQSDSSTIIEVTEMLVERPRIVGAGVVRSALELLGSMRTDAAAELLLQVGGSRAQSAESRRIAMEQFNAMIEWREAAARWERSRAGVAQRDDAVVALVETLEAEGSNVEQQREAVRGLGLLGAETELPRLIALLGDAELGAAAREAIDALHAEER